MRFRSSSVTDSHLFHLDTEYRLERIQIRNNAFNLKINWHGENDRILLHNQRLQSPSLFLLLMLTGSPLNVKIVVQKIHCGVGE
jgi:hypothetical protein